MKTPLLLITVFLSLGTIFTATNLAFSQEMQPGQENIQFIPVVPTEKSSVTALIQVFSLDIYCTNYTIDHVLSSHVLVMNVKTKTIPGGKCPMPAESYVSLRQGIGQLGFGTYDVKLFINGTQKAATKLYVSQGQIEITATGKYTDKQGDAHIIGDIKNTASYPVRLVQIDVSFVNGDEVIEDEKLYTTMAVLMPQTSSGFDLLVDSKNLANMKYFVRAGSFLKDTSKIQQGLKLSTESSWQSSSGIGMVSGIVLNTANINASQVKVVCVLYDQTGTGVLDSIFEYTNPSSIASGQSSDFVLSSHYPITSQFTPNCNAESPQLAILSTETVPEFAMPVIVFVASLTFMILFKKSLQIVNNP